MNKGMKKIKKHKLLDIFAWVRTGRTLDRVAERNVDYCNSLKRQDMAYDALDKAGLSKEQQVIVNEALSASSECGRTYSVVAYKLGLRDGIRLKVELGEMK